MENGTKKKIGKPVRILCFNSSSAIKDIFLQSIKWYFLFNLDLTVLDFKIPKFIIIRRQSLENYIATAD